MTNTRKLMDQLSDLDCAAGELIGLIEIFVEQWNLQYPAPKPETRRVAELAGIGATVLQSLYGRDTTTLDDFHAAAEKVECLMAVIRNEMALEGMDGESQKSANRIWALVKAVTAFLESSGMRRAEALAPAPEAELA